jgi:radical SAM superfamily enzyme
VYDETLKRVNRGHTISDSITAIHKTAERGIQCGGHLIFGLPGEPPDQMLESASLISTLPLHSIKFHQLQLFRNTIMAQEYEKNPSDFTLFTEDEYMDFLIEYITRFNPRIIIERIAGETPPRFAVIRPWGPRYDQILVKFERLLEERNCWQGKNYPIA